MELFSGDSWYLIALGGFAIGFLLGLTGVGAGALTTPMLISGFNVPPAFAVGTDLLFAAITKTTAAWRHHKYGNIHWRVLGLLALGSLTATLATLAWLHFAAPDTDSMAIVIRRCLAVALVISACAIPLVPVLMRFQDSPIDGVADVKPLWTIFFGLFLGFVVTLTSVGAGAIGVAVLSLLYPTMRPRRIVGTDIVHAVPLTLLAGLGHLSMGHVQFDLLIALLIGSVPGIMIGSRLIGYLPNWLLRVILACVLLLAAYMLVGEENFNFGAWISALS